VTRQNIHMEILSGILLIILAVLAVVIIIYLVLSRKSLKKSNRKHLGRLSKQEKEIEKANTSLSQQELLARSFRNDLREQQKSLVATSLSLEKHNSFLINLLERVQKINLKTKEEVVRRDIQAIIELIQKQVKEKSSVDFEYLYTSANSDFIKKLTGTHPGLTPMEKRLCVFLQMNLSTKEIADITMQNFNAIEMARHRLRKKLELKRCDNLTTYLAKFSE